MKTDDFDYSLPEELIAQSPAPVRDACRMLVVGRENGELQDCIFRDIEKFLCPGDLLVANETRVRPARLLGAKRGTGGAAEVFLLRPATASSLSACGIGGRDIVPNNKCAYWEALVRPGKRLKPGAVVCFEGDVGVDGGAGGTGERERAGVAGGAVVAGKASDAGVSNEYDGESASAINTNANPTRTNVREVVMTAEIVGFVEGSGGERVVKLSTDLQSLDEALHIVGNTPLPPYIKNYTGDKEMYQTVYSRTERSAAAPTAGLHFTPGLIDRLRAKDIGWETVDLEVGLDTFRIVDESDPLQHKMHTELFTVPQRTVDAIERTKRAGGRVIAVGTTSVRSLESAATFYEEGRGQECELREQNEKKRDRNDQREQHEPRDQREQGNLREQQQQREQHEPREQRPPQNTHLLCACERQATSLYILPSYKFRVVDGLITNFHVPRSTLLMLVSALSTRENIMRAYQHAIDERYRFFSFGDAMFIV